MGGAFWGAKAPPEGPRVDFRRAMWSPSMYKTMDRKRAKFLRKGPGRVEARLRGCLASIILAQGSLMAATWVEAGPLVAPRELGVPLGVPFDAS